MSKEDDDDDSSAIGVGRYPCMPSLVALQQMRNRLHLAYLGKKLMKWSALASGRELRRIGYELTVIYNNFSEDMANAYLLLARCRYHSPGLNKIVLENVGEKAAVTLQTSVKMVSGVRILEIGIKETDTEPYPHLGISQGGQVIKETKLAWLELLKRMIKIVELRTSFQTVEYAHKSSTKKQNVLQKLIIPRIIATLQYILSELEEREREEIFRLKRFKQLKVKIPKKSICICCLKMFKTDKPLPCSGIPLCPTCQLKKIQGPEPELNFKVCDYMEKDVLKYLENYEGEKREFAKSYAGISCCIDEETPQDIQNKTAKSVTIILPEEEDEEPLIFIKEPEPVPEALPEIIPELIPKEPKWEPKQEPKQEPIPICPQCGGAHPPSPVHTIICEEHGKAFATCPVCSLSHISGVYTPPVIRELREAKEDVTSPCKSMTKTPVCGHLSDCKDKTSSEEMIQEHFPLRGSCTHQVKSPDTNKAIEDSMKLKQECVCPETASLSTESLKIGDTIISNDGKTTCFKRLCYNSADSVMFIEKVEKTITVTKIKNDDGTVSEERIVTIKTNRRNVHDEVAGDVSGVSPCTSVHKRDKKISKYHLKGRENKDGSELGGPERGPSPASQESLTIRDKSFPKVVKDAATSDSVYSLLNVINELALKFHDLARTFSNRGSERCGDFPRMYDPQLRSCVSDFIKRSASKHDSDHLQYPYKSQACQRAVQDVKSVEVLKPHVSSLSMPVSSDEYDLCRCFRSDSDENELCCDTATQTNENNCLKECSPDGGTRRNQHKCNASPMYGCNICQKSIRVPIEKSSTSTHINFGGNSKTCMMIYDMEIPGLNYIRQLIFGNAATSTTGLNESQTSMKTVLANSCIKSESKPKKEIVPKIQSPQESCVKACTSKYVKKTEPELALKILSPRQSSNMHAHVEKISAVKKVEHDKEYKDQEICLEFDKIPSNSLSKYCKIANDTCLNRQSDSSDDSILFIEKTQKTVTITKTVDKDGTISAEKIVIIKTNKKSLPGKNTNNDNEACMRNKNQARSYNKDEVDKHQHDKRRHKLKTHDHHNTDIKINAKLDDNPLKNNPPIHDMQKYHDKTTSTEENTGCDNIVKPKFDSSHNTKKLPVVNTESVKDVDSMKNDCNPPTTKVHSCTAKVHPCTAKVHPCTAKVHPDSRKEAQQAHDKKCKPIKCDKMVSCHVKDTAKCDCSLPLLNKRNIDNSIMLVKGSRGKHANKPVHCTCSNSFTKLIMLETKIADVDGHQSILTIEKTNLPHHKSHKSCEKSMEIKASCSSCNKKKNQNADTIPVYEDAATWYCGCFVEQGKENNKPHKSRPCATNNAETPVDECCDQKKSLKKPEHGNVVVVDSKSLQDAQTRDEHVDAKSKIKKNTRAKPTIIYDVSISKANGNNRRMQDASTSTTGLVEADIDVYHPWHSSYSQQSSYRPMKLGLGTRAQGIKRGSITYNIRKSSLNSKDSERTSTLNGESAKAKSTPTLANTNNSLANLQQPLIHVAKSKSADYVKMGEKICKTCLLELSDAFPQVFKRKSKDFSPNCKICQIKKKEKKQNAYSEETHSCQSSKSSYYGETSKHICVDLESPGPDLKFNDSDCPLQLDKDSYVRVKVSATHKKTVTNNEVVSKLLKQVGQDIMDDDIILALTIGKLCVCEKSEGEKEIQQIKKRLVQCGTEKIETRDIGTNPKPPSLCDGGIKNTDSKIYRVATRYEPKKSSHSSKINKQDMINCSKCNKLTPKLHKNTAESAIQSETICIKPNSTYTFNDKSPGVDMNEHLKSNSSYTLSKPNYKINTTKTSFFNLKKSEFDRNVNSFNENIMRSKIFVKSTLPKNSDTFKKEKLKDDIKFIIQANSTYTFNDKKSGCVDIIKSIKPNTSFNFNDKKSGCDDKIKSIKPNTSFSFNDKKSACNDDDKIKSIRPNTSFSFNDKKCGPDDIIKSIGPNTSYAFNENKSASKKISVENKNVKSQNKTNPVPYSYKNIIHKEIKSNNQPLQNKDSKSAKANHNLTIVIQASPKVNQDKSSRPTSSKPVTTPKPIPKLVESKKTCIKSCPLQRDAYDKTKIAKRESHLCPACKREMIFADVSTDTNTCNRKEQMTMTSIAREKRSFENVSTKRNRRKLRFCSSCHH